MEGHLLAKVITFCWIISDHAISSAILSNIGSCAFVFDMIIYNKTLVGFSMLDLQLITCNSKYCPQDVYMQISLTCEDFTGDYVRHLASIGFNPIVSLRSQGRFGTAITSLDAILVEGTRCSCYSSDDINTSSSCQHVCLDKASGLAPSQADCLQSSRGICQEPNLTCYLVWIAPLILKPDVPFYDITIASNMAGDFVRSKRVLIYPNKLAHFASILPDYWFNSSLNIWHVNSSTGVSYALVDDRHSSGAMFFRVEEDEVLISWTEFESYVVIKFPFAIRDEHFCPMGYESAFNIVVIGSRILLVTEVGIVELLNGSEKVLLRDCITAAVQHQIADDEFILLVVLSQGLKVLVSHCKNDAVVVFHQQELTVNNRTMKEVASDVHSGAQEMTILHAVYHRRSGFSLILTSTESVNRLYHVLQWKESNATKMFSVPWDERKGILVLTRLKTFDEGSADVFAFGNALLLSTDGGLTWFTMWYEESCRIKDVACSLDGYLVFRTEENLLFVGSVSSSEWLRLAGRVENGIYAAGLFFDRSGSLNQIVFNVTARCIKKEFVPLTEFALDSLMSTAKSKLQNLLTGETNSNEVRSLKVIPNDVFEAFRKIEQDLSCPWLVSFRFPNSSYFLRATKTEYCFKDPSQNGNFLRLTSTTSSSELEWRSQENLQESEESLLQRNHTMRESCLPMDLDSSFGLPSDAALELGECLSFSAFVAINPHLLELTDIAVSARLLNSDHGRVSVTNSLDYFSWSRTFQIRVCDSGVKRQQHRPGVGQVVTLLHVQIFPANINCNFQDRAQTNSYTRMHLGCPPKRHVEFNELQTLGQRSQSYCIYTGKEDGCFAFENVFSPVFTLMDDVTGRKDVFSGNFTLTVVGGGRYVSQIRKYSEYEQNQYNRKKGSSLVWTRVNISDGYTSTQNAMNFQWLCGADSPCGMIAPDGLACPAYFFLIEFSNKDVDYSNCDYTFQFLVQIYGIPADGLYPSFMVVLVCIAMMTSAVASHYFIQSKYPDFMLTFRRRIVKELTSTTLRLHALLTSNQVSILTVEEHAMTGTSPDGTDSESANSQLGCASKSSVQLGKEQHQVDKAILDAASERQRADKTTSTSDLRRHRPEKHAGTA